MEIDPRTGLPVEAMAWEDLTKQGQKIRVTTVKKIAKALKNELACGGTYKDDVIELQGEHVKKVKPALVKLGFDEESIE